MPGLMRNQQAAQYFAASGEATPETKLPEKFQAQNARSSAIPGGYEFAVDYQAYKPGQPSAVVRRWPRTVGMRYLYGRGARRQPIQHFAAGGVQNPNISAFQPMLMGPIKNAGFNDALFQAGYPGFNLGTSFAVPTLQTQIQRPPVIGSTSITGISQNVNAGLKFQRKSGGLNSQ